MMKPSMLGSLLLSALAGGLLCGTYGPPKPALPAKVTAPPRDQPYITAMSVWQGQIVVEADRFYSIDPVKATATAVALPGMTKVIALATRGKITPLALCRNAQGLCLLARDQFGWTEQPLPREVKRSAEDFRLLANATSVVLLNQRGCFRQVRGAWTAIPQHERPAVSLPHLGAARRHYLLAGDVLYEGYDNGEWGGCLLALNLRTGKWEDIDSQGKATSHLPVRDLRVGPNGTIWVVEGLAHLGLAEGSLWVYEGGTWKRFASTEGLVETTITRWTLPATSMDGIDIAHGLPYVLAEQLGVLRYDGQRWKQLTRGWPEGQYVSCFRLASAGVAVIGMTDAGVLLWDLCSNEVKRVALRPPTPERNLPLPLPLPVP